LKNHFVHPKPWNSPARDRKCSENSVGLELEKPQLELYFCCSEDFTLESDSLSQSDKAKTEITQTSKTTKSDDGISSCSTFDSGIQRSNTLSDESVKSLRVLENNRKSLEQKSQFLSAVHCNGDFSDDDEHLDVIDECFVADEETIQKIVEEETKRIPMLNRCLLTVGQSFDYDSSPTNPLTDSIETILHQESDAYASETMLSKSISEEVLNRSDFTADDDCERRRSLEDNNKLKIHSADDLDCLSSSSTSSLVILNKSCKLSESRAPTPQSSTSLLSPAQIGSNDAFMLFMCLTILLQNRDKIMQNKMDANDVQLYFDNMIRKHSVRSVLSDARNLFHTYLSQWHQECIS